MTTEHLPAVLAALARGEGIDLREAPSSLLWARAATEGLEPLLAASIPTPLATPRAAEALTAAVVDSLSWEREAERIAALLASAGIPAACFKGFALARTVWKEPHLRPHSDLDLLIQADDRGRAIDAFVNAGYRKLPTLEGRWIRHQATFVHDDCPVPLPIDLHWRPSNSAALAFTIDVPQILNRSTALPGSSLRGVDPVDAFCLAAVHAAGHHHHEVRAVWFADLVRLATALDDDDLRTLASRSSEWGITSVVRWMIAETARVVGWGEAEQMLRAVPRHTGERSAIVLIRSQRWADLQSLGWRGRAGYLRELLLPSREYMRARFPDSHAPLTLLWLYRLVRRRRHP
jgi:hypothetical protein